MNTTRRAAIATLGGAVVAPLPLDPAIVEAIAGLVQRA